MKRPKYIIVRLDRDRWIVCERRGSYYKQLSRVFTNREQAEVMAGEEQHLDDMG